MSDYLDTVLTNGPLVRVLPDRVTGCTGYKGAGYGTHAAAGSGLCAERGLSLPGVSLPGGRPSRLTSLRQSVQFFQAWRGETLSRLGGFQVDPRMEESDGTQDPK